MPTPRSPQKAVQNIRDGEISDDHAVVQQGDTALKAARRNLGYLYDPKDWPQPTRFRTRAFLRSLRYITVFVFWRLIRWAKYIAFGSLIAAVSATALGGAITGIGWIAAPPTIGASILSGCVWQVGKYGARKLNKKWKKGGGDVGEEARERAQDEHPLRDTGTYGQETGPQAVPW